jgi:hypothetical protein
VKAKVSEMTLFANSVLVMGLLMGSVLPGVTEPAERQSNAAQEPATLRVPVDLVTLNVSVTNKQGNMVSGLKRKEFKVFEDKIEQKITFFSSERTPYPGDSFSIVAAVWKK